jgi:hypothetical protein
LGWTPVEVVSMAAQDTLVRHDAYSLDLLAWALHKRRPIG